MLNIGTFARHGRVSIRMLRHYDAIGLLRPARKDAQSGYRVYEPAQLSRLNRIVALKDLGFTLEQVASIVDDAVGPQELRGMLILRRAELQAQLTAGTDRLAQVEARLRAIESEDAMPTEDIQVRSLPATRVAELTGFAASFEPGSIGPVIQPLYRELMRRLAAADVPPIGPATAWYEDTPGEHGGVLVHAGIPVGTAAVPDVGVVELPAVASAATIVHRGPMDTVLSSIQALGRWIDAHGYRSAGYNRECYLDYGSGEPETWVTELQEPLVATGAEAGDV